MSQLKQEYAKRHIPTLKLLIPTRPITIYLPPISPCYEYVNQNIVLRSVEKPDSNLF